MHIRKIFKFLMMCIFCATTFVASSYAAGNMPYGDIGEYGNWITADNMQQYNSNLSGDVENNKHFKQIFIKQTLFQSKSKLV